MSMSDQSDQFAVETERSRSAVLRLIQVGLNGHDRAVMDALVAGDVVRHGPGGAVKVGREPAGRSMAERSWALFPDWRYEIEALLAEGELVAARVRASGTHASGAAVATTWTQIYRVRNGQVVESWLDVDNAGLIRQLQALGEPVDREF